MLRKTLKWLGYLILVVLAILLIGIGVVYFHFSNEAKNQLAKLGEEATTLTESGITFRDLNKNDRLDPYEDPTEEIDVRVKDLLSQMTLAEKAGTMFITISGITSNGDPQDGPVFDSGPFGIILPFMMGTNANMLVEKHMNSFNILGSNPADILAKHNNLLQKRAERTRLGIPVTIASDPRHEGAYNPGAIISTPAFSQWPGALGLAATRDSQLVRHFADIARQEYLAVGIRLALHPMADLATEPRWGRTNGTFGEDAELSAKMTEAYVLGFQGDSLGNHSVACMTKHFSGGGPQKDGEDAHFPYGAEQVYPGDHFDYHIIPFVKGALPAKTAQIMPYYGIPVGQTDEEVAFAFNKSIITTLLRDTLGYDGVICTDWNVITDGRMGPARAWGVEDLSELERVKKVIEAGCDQFGGEARPELVVQLVENGDIREERINTSVARILRDKFRLGLFENPYVDEAEADKICGQETFRAEGRKAQEKSLVLLKNEELLPLKRGTKLYLVDAPDPSAYAKYGEVVDQPEDADVIVLRTTTPFDPRNEYFLESFFHQGRLHYNEEELGRILPLLQQKPSVVVAHIDRPTILTELDADAKALIAEFGSADDAVAGLLFGQFKPSGKLPVELPSSPEAVAAQQEDVPYDSENPLYPFGAGMEDW